MGSIGTPIQGQPDAGESPDLELPGVGDSLPPEPDADPDGGAPPEGEEPKGDKQPKGDGKEELESKEDARVIPGYIRALKDKSPDDFRRAKTDFFDLRGRREIHPTVQAARDEHELVASNGGAEGIAQLREDGHFFKEAAQQFLSGKREFYADLFEEDQTAAEMGVPIMLDLLREKSKDVYESTVARLWQDEFTNAGFLKALKALDQAVEAGDKAGAQQIIDGFAAWQQRIQSKANRAEDPRLKRVMAERASEQESRSKREKDEFIRTYQSNALNSVVADGAKVFDSFFRNRKIEESDRNDLLRESFALANRAVLADKDFVAQRDKHLERGDAASALRLTKARYAKEMPEAVKRVARRYGMLAGNPKPAPANKDGAPSGGAQPRPEQGFVAVNQRPERGDINESATAALARKANMSYGEFIVSGRAVLNDGRKVSWAHLKNKVA